MDPDHLLFLYRNTFTPRQRQIMFFLANGERNCDIAWLLGTSEAAINTAIYKLKKKISFKTTEELIEFQRSLEFLMLYEYIYK